MQLEKIYNLKFIENLQISLHFPILTKVPIKNSINIYSNTNQQTQQPISTKINTQFLNISTPDYKKAAQASVKRDHFS